MIDQLTEEDAIELDKKLIRILNDIAISEGLGPLGKLKPIKQEGSPKKDLSSLTEELDDVIEKLMPSIIQSNQSNQAKQEESLSKKDLRFARIKEELDSVIYETGVAAGIDLIQFNDLYESFKEFDWSDYLDSQGMEIYRNMYELFFLLQRVSQVCDNLKPDKGEDL